MPLPVFDNGVLAGWACSNGNNACNNASTMTIYRENLFNRLSTMTE